MSVTCWEEKLTDALIEEVRPLLEAHYQEIAWRQDAIPLDIDVERYKALWADGHVLVIAAREKDLTLVGYNVYFINHHLHYKSTVYAMNDVLYVKPSARGAAIALKMLRVAEDILSRRYERLVMGLHIKEDHDWGVIARRARYKKIEATWFKLVGG